jgi:hypothetical protein
MREKKSIETIVGMIIARLGSGNSLQMCGEVYGIVKSITSIIMKEFCETIRNHLKPLVMFKLFKNKVKEIILKTYM